jgi:hypothetical protein
MHKMHATQQLAMLAVERAEEKIREEQAVKKRDDKLRETFLRCCACGENKNLLDGFSRRQLNSTSRKSRRTPPRCKECVSGRKYPQSAE